MVVSTLLAVIQTDPVTATEVWISTLSPEQMAKSDAYFEGGYWLTLWNFLIGLLVAGLLLGGQRSAKFRDGLQTKLPNWLVTPAYIVCYTLITSIVVFPMTVYENFFREKNYALLNQNFGGWFGEQMTGLGLSLLIGTLAIWGLYALIRKLGPSWRWWGAGAAIGFMALILLISPVFISPLFNTYTSMEEGPLRTEILAMAEANGVPADNVYVFDSSKQSGRISANVSGFLGTTRISLTDTLLDRASPAAVKSVMGHEIGHYALGHSYEMLLSFGLVIFFGFVFTHWAYEALRQRCSTRWNIGPLGDIAGLPLFFVILSVFFFVMTPVTNSIIRSNETEADIFGLNAAAEPDGFAEAAIMLAEYRKVRPGHWEEIIFHDHPSNYNRILMSMKWKSAHEVIDATELGGEVSAPPAGSD
jgi:STE24 endopeptidase